ncbi:ATP-binding protein [Streptosporangium sp. NPDC000563]|uniref:ATP-binding protein n=1 Tax=Streptosporangium sp. NPDC000563 TaxID=3154366 RepID=UPI003323AF3E
MAAQFLSLLVGVLADRLRTTTTTDAVRSPHPGRIPGWPASLGHTPVISQRFAATPDQVKPARAFVAALLGDDHPLRDDAMLLTSELATNAVEHARGPLDAQPADTEATDAGPYNAGPYDDTGPHDTRPYEHDAGPVERTPEFVVTVAFLSHGVLITVQDPGASEIPCTRKPSPETTGGRGLLLVNDLATRWGFHRDPTGTVIWFELRSNQTTTRIR